MPGFGNNYFAVEKEFRLLAVDGHSPSNTYIGSSRSYDAVLLAVNARPGDEIHDLVGGMFHVSGETGLVSSIRMVPPKSILEKSYGPSPEKSRRDGLVEGGYLKELPEPTLAADYNSARERKKDYEPNQGGVRNIDRDPLNDIADELCDEMENNGFSPDVQSINFLSETAYDPAKLVFTVDGGPEKFKVFFFDSGKIRLVRPRSIDVSADRVIDGDLKNEGVGGIAEKFVQYIDDIVAERNSPTP